MARTDRELLVWFVWLSFGGVITLLGMLLRDRIVYASLAVRCVYSSVLKSIDYGMVQSAIFGAR